MSRGQVAGGAKDVSGQISGRQCQAYARIEEELALRQKPREFTAVSGANWSRARGRAQRPTRVPSSCGFLELAQVVGLIQSPDDDATQTHRTDSEEARVGANPNCSGRDSRERCAGLLGLPWSSSPWTAQPRSRAWWRWASATSEPSS